MRIIRPSAERGLTSLGWLKSRHSFSFGDYQDAAWMGFRSLRVINDDVVQPSSGFDTHPHRDMEILTWVLAGSLKHRDSTGGGGVLGPGGVQGMSAGSGILHSEFNPSPTAPARFLQVWIRPDRRGGTPSYGQAEVAEFERRGRWAVVAGPGQEVPMPIRADAVMLATLLTPGERLNYPLASGRHAWLQVARGSAVVDGEALVEGDGMAVLDEPDLRVEARSDCELILFDLA